MHGLNTDNLMKNVLKVNKNKSNTNVPKLDLDKNLFKLKPIKSNIGTINKSKKTTKPNTNIKKVFSTGIQKANNFEGMLKSGIKTNLFQSAQKRTKAQVGLSMFGDYDKDGVPNIFDCDPRDFRKQAVIHSELGKMDTSTTIADKAEQNISESEPKQEVQYIKGMKPRVTSLHKYYKQHPDELVKDLSQTAKTVGSEIWSATKTGAKEIVGAGKEIAQETGLIDRKPESDINIQLQNRQDKDIQKMIQEQVKQKLQNKDTQLTSQDLKILSELASKKNVPTTIKTEQTQLQRLKSGRGNLSTNVMNLSPGVEAALPGSKQSWEQRARSGLRITGASPSNLTMAATVPQRRPYGMIVGETIATPKTSYNAQYMASNLLTTKPTLITGQEIPQTPTLLTGTPIQQSQITSQPTYIPPVQSAPPTQIQTIGTYDDSSPPPGKPAIDEQGRIWSPKSKKYVMYPRGPYKKHQKTVIVRQETQG